MMRLPYFGMSKPPIKGGYSILTNGITDTSLAPILERLAVFTTFMERNDAEHHDLVKSVEDNRREREKQIDSMIHVFQKTRVWSIVVMLAGMIGVGLIVGLFGMLGRGALP